MKLAAAASKRFSEGLILTLLCLAAFLGNRYRLFLFHDFELMFGSLFVMLAVVRFRTETACAVGAVAAAAILPLWGHPWAALVFFLEAVFVALCQRRKRGNLVLADTVFWIVVGMPLLFALYHGLAGLPTDSTLLIALKESANALFNTLLATLALYARVLLRSQHPSKRPVPLQEIVFTALVAVTLIPAMLGLVQDVKGRAHEQENSFNRELSTVSSNTQKFLNVWLANSMKSVTALARHMEKAHSIQPAVLQHEAEVLKMGTPNLQAITIFDREGVAIVHATDEGGLASIPKASPELLCNNAAKNASRPVIGDVVKSDAGPHHAGVPLLAPLRAEGSYRGCLCGLIKLDQLAERVGLLIDNKEMEVTVVDRGGRVVACSSKRFRPLDLFLHAQGKPHFSLDRRPGQRSDHNLDGGIAVLRRDNTEVIVTERLLSPETPWAIVVERPLLPLFGALTKFMNKQLLFLWGTIVLIIPVSHYLSGRLANSLQRLQLATSELPKKLGETVKPWPNSNILEVQLLSANFHTVAHALTVAFRDLTSLNQTLEQRVAERTRELSIKSDLLLNLSRELPGAIFQFQLLPDGRSLFPYSSEAIKEIYEMPPEELAEDGAKVFSLLHPSDWRGFIASLEESRSSGDPWQYEYRVNLPERGVRWRFLNARPQKQEDGSVLWHGFITDISQRKLMEEELAESERRLRTIIELTPNMVMIQEEGRFTYLNPAATTKLGAREPEELLGRPILERIQPEDRAQAEERFTRVQQNGTAVSAAELRLSSLIGEALVVEAVSMPISQQGRDCVLTIAVDVTARKRAEELLYQQTVRLEAEVHERQAAEKALALQQAQLSVLNRSLEERVAEELARSREKDQIMITQSRQAAMGEMVGNIAHQWRQPLNALGLLLANIEDAFHYHELDEAYLAETVAQGNRLIQKMSSTINDFRSFFRPDRDVVPFSVVAQIEEAIALVESSFGNDRIAIGLEAPKDLILYGFPNQFSQVFLNLLTNAKEAIKHRSEEGGHIAVTLAREGENAQIKVRDDGIGIPPDTMPRIFEPYFSTKQGGTGVGLYMSKMIIERNMKGRIEAHNVEGGAEFTVTVPLAGGNHAPGA